MLCQICLTLPPPNFPAIHTYIGIYVTVYTYIYRYICDRLCYTYIYRYICDHLCYTYIYRYICDHLCYTYIYRYICDHLCENWPCSHLVVIRETLFKDFKLKLPAFARTRPLLFNRTGLSNLLNKIQFTFEVVPCLILGLFRRFF